MGLRGELDKVQTTVLTNVVAGLLSGSHKANNGAGDTVAILDDVYGSSHHITLMPRPLRHTIYTRR